MRLRVVALCQAITSKDIDCNVAGQLVLCFASPDLSHTCLARPQQPVLHNEWPLKTVPEHGEGPMPCT